MSLFICLNARSTLFNQLFESIHTIILTLGIKDAHAYFTSLEWVNDN